MRKGSLSPPVTALSSRYDTVLAYVCVDCHRCHRPKHEIGRKRSFERRRTPRRPSAHAGFPAFLHREIYLDSPFRAVTAVTEAANPDGDGIVAVTTHGDSGDNRVIRPSQPYAERMTGGDSYSRSEV